MDRMPLFVFIVWAVCSPAIADPALGLPPLNVPADNSQTPEKIALGKRLFHEQRFSANNSISCASCHQASKAFTDGQKLATGINGAVGVRNTPTLLNVGYYQSFFLDGREPTLEQQALKPILNSLEHGISGIDAILSVVVDDQRYVGQFKQVFGIDSSEIDTSHIAKAIASYERTLIAGNSPFDQYYFGRDRSKLSVSAANGMRVFRRKGNCANCHEISWDNALFMDNRFYNIGIGSKILEPLLRQLIPALNKGGSPEDYPLSPQQKSAMGRFQVTGVIADMGKFKTPTLRNIALTAPYMHDGSRETLEEVVEYYDQGGEKNQFLDPAIFPLHLTDQEKKDLVEFMKGLTSS